MSKRPPVQAVLAVVVALSGCSDGDGPSDLGVSSLPDLAVDAAVAAPDFGKGAMLAGKRVVTGRYSLLGVTDDDQIVFYDSKTFVQAVPLGGGASVGIDPDAQLVRLDGKVVFSWHGITDATLVGRLSAWSAAAGLHEVARASTIDDAAATRDGAYLLYTDGAGDGGKTLDFVVARADGTDARTVLAGRATGLAGCQPKLAAVGPRFVIASCDAPGDGSVGAARVVTVEPASGSVTTLFDGVRPIWMTDARGTRLLAVATDGTGLVRALDGAGPTTLVDGNVEDAQFLADGASLLYTTTAGALKRTSLQTIAPVTLVDTGARALRGVSPDEKWVLYRDRFDAVAFTSDLSLASTEVPASPVELIAGPTGAVFGDRFTQDSSHVLYYLNVDSNGAGTLAARSLAGTPGLEQPLGDLVWLSFSVGGTKIVYNDRWKPTQLAGRADLRVLDLAAGTPPVLLAASAEQDFAFSRARDRVVYSYTMSAATGGLYVAPIP